MFEVQNIIVAVVLLGAIVYAGVVLMRKSRSFSTKSACSDDCGCSSKTKSAKIAH